MLNINGSSEVGEPQTNGGSGVQGHGHMHSLYDYYKLPVVVDGNGGLGKGGITLITSDGKAVTDSALQEMVWRWVYRWMVGDVDKAKRRY